MANKTLGSIVNAGLKEIGETEITAFTSANLLERNLIDVINNTITEINEEEEYAWAIKRAVLPTVAKITTGSVAVTNDTTTVTSVDSAGANATNFGSVAVGMYIRLTADKTSYLITAVDSVSTPNTVTIETEYAGTTTTASGYTILQDTYAISTANFDEIKYISYGDNGDLGSILRGQQGDGTLGQFDSIGDLVVLTGGDLHRDAGGKPRAFARYSPDASDNNQIVLWPYPDDVYVMEVWYKQNYTAATAFATSVFGNDAPDIAYVALDYACRSYACKWDEDDQKAMYWEGKSRECIKKVKSRENRTNHSGNAIKVHTGRRYLRGTEVRSQIGFDTKSARRY